MANLSGSGWNSKTLGTLNSGIAALGRRSLADALGAYGGFSELAEALSALNDGEFQAAADELEKEENGGCGEGFHIETDSDGNETCVEDEMDCGEGFHIETDSDGNQTCVEDEARFVMPDISGTFTRLIRDFTDWAKNTGKAVNQQPETQIRGGGDVWFVPNFPAVYQASIDVSCGCAGAPTTPSGAPYVVPPYIDEGAAETGDLAGGVEKIMAHADVLDIPNLHLPFDRETLNEQYRDLHKDDKKSTTTGGASVLKQQIDYVACAERAYRLRHATPVRCILHHSVRKEAHGHEVGVFQRVLTILQDNLKASSPPPPDTLGAGLSSYDPGSVTATPPEEA